MLNEPTQLKINETLEKQFKAFYNELEQEQCFDTIEFRLYYQKKINKFIEFQCPEMAKDLKQMKENYLKRNRA